jgi:alkylated DNA repair protein alkB family protein 8
MSFPSPVRSTLPKSESDANELEQEHVHKVYNDIAHHFSDTRYKPWPRVVDFLRTFSSGSLVLDVGCGNGKYMNIRNDLMMVGKKENIFFFLLFEFNFFE